MSDFHQPVPLLTAVPSRNGRSSVERYPSVQEKGLNFMDVWEAVRRGKWIVLLTTFLVTAAVVTYTRFMEPVYRATSIVSIKSDGGGYAGGSGAGMIAVGQRRNLDTEVGLLQNSFELANHVVQRLHRVIAVRKDAASFPVLRPDDDPHATSGSIAFSLLRAMEFQPSEAQSMIFISMESTSPDEAMLVANAYAEEYQTFIREKSRASLVATRLFLEEQAAKSRQELGSLESQWEAFATEKQVYTQGQEGEALVAQYTALQQRRDESAFALQQGETTLALLRQQLDQLGPDLEKRVLQEGVASELEQQIIAIDQRLAELKIEAEQYYAVTPSLRGREEEVPALAELVQRIAYFTEHKTRLVERRVAEVNRDDAVPGGGGQLGYVSQLKGKITERQIENRALEAQIDVLDARLQSFEGRLQSIPRQAIQRENLQRRIAQAEQWYGTLVQQLQQTKIAEEAELGYIEVLMEAMTPQVPVRPNVRQNVILGVLLGIGLGLALAFVRQATRTTFSQPEELADQGYHLLGVVPQMTPEIRASFGGKETVEVKGRMLSTSLITHLDPWSPIAENFRLIRTNLQYLNPKAPIKTLLVTSPEGGDGKSVTTINVAIAMAQAGRRTLLIDADLRRPVIHRLLGLNRSPGLSELLRDPSAFDPQAFTAFIPGLTCIPAGYIDVPPAELFGEDRMRHFLDAVGQAFDAIIIDSPPVLPVTDAVILAPQCDATVIVVSAGKTELRALDVVQETLAKVGAPVVGTIINRFDLRKAGGYKYGYGYGSYEQYGYSQAPR